MLATLAVPSPAQNHRGNRSVEAHDAEQALNQILLATSRRAKRGARSQRIIQREKDVSQGRCRPWRVVIELLFSAQDMGVSAEELEAVPRALLGLVRTRAGVAPAEDIFPLIRGEGEVDCQFDALEHALRDGELSPENLRRGVELATKQIDALIALRDKMNEMLYARGPRMVAL